MAGYRTERRKAIEEDSCGKISKAVRGLSVKAVVERGLKARKKFITAFLRISGKNKIYSVVTNVGIVLSVFRKAWAQISRKMLGDVSLTLVTVCRGFVARKRFEAEIANAHEKAYFLTH